MVSKPKKVEGRLWRLGKALKVVFDEESERPLRFFCFVDDVEAVIHNNNEFVRIFLDRPPEDRQA